MSGTEATTKTTGGPATDAERQAANWLAGQLRDRDREAVIEPISVRISDAGTIAIHSLLAVVGGLLSLKSPLLGAVICLIAAFSFYMERSLGFALIGLLMPRRASQNVVSTPAGARLDDGVEAVLCCGYDLPSTDPVNETLIRMSTGWLTVDRVVFWAGMVLVFLTSMARLAAAEGTFTDILQMLASVVLLCVLAAQVDRILSGRPTPAADGLGPGEAVLAVVDEVDGESPINAREPLAVCFFGAESASAKGAARFFAGHEVGNHQNRPLIINYRAGSGGKSGLTRREGDLASLRMDGAEGLESEIEPDDSRLSRLTAATVARRQGLRAVTVLDNDDDAIDLGLDLIASATPEVEDVG